MGPDVPPKRGHPFPATLSGRRSAGVGRLPGWSIPPGSRPGRGKALAYRQARCVCCMGENYCDSKSVPPATPFLRNCGRGCPGTLFSLRGPEPDPRQHCRNARDLGLHIGPTADPVLRGKAGRQRRQRTTKFGQRKTRTHHRTPPSLSCWASAKTAKTTPKTPFRIPRPITWNWSIGRVASSSKARRFLSPSNCRQFCSV